MPGTPATSPNFGVNRYSDADEASFSTQVNEITDTFDAHASKRWNVRAGLAGAQTAAAFDCLKFGDPGSVALPGSPSTGDAVKIANDYSQVVTVDGYVTFGAVAIDNFQLTNAGQIVELVWTGTLWLVTLNEVISPQSGAMQSGQFTSGNTTETIVLPHAGTFLLTFHGTGSDIEDFHVQILQWSGNSEVGLVVADLINGNYIQTADNPPGHLTVAYQNAAGYVPGGSAARPGFSSSENSGELIITADSQITGWSYSLTCLFDASQA